MPAQLVRLATDRSIPAALRRRYLSLLAASRRREAAEQKVLAKRLHNLGSQTRKAIAASLGAQGFRRYRALRETTASATRARRLKASHALLEELGFDRVREGKLRSTYFTAARSLLDLGEFTDIREVAPVGCSPWVEHRAPFVGDVDSVSFETTGDVNAPAFTRQVNRTTGVLRSGLRTGVSGAGDNDQIVAEHRAGFTTWHTTLESGPLEGFMVFEFRQRATLSGEVDDEFGFSRCLHSQFAGTRLRVVTAALPEETSESLILTLTDVHWGADGLWKRAASNPRDVHWFYFRTATAYPQGTPLIVEAGVINYAWFEADDMSIDMQCDLDLRLEKIMIRSCPS